MTQSKFIYVFFPIFCLIKQTFIRLYQSRLFLIVLNCFSSFFDDPLHKQRHSWSTSFIAFPTIFPSVVIHSCYYGSSFLIFSIQWVLSVPVPCYIKRFDPYPFCFVYHPCRADVKDAGICPGSYFFKGQAVWTYIS